MENAQMPMSGSTPTPSAEAPHKHHNRLVMAVFLVVAVVIAVLLMFVLKWAQFDGPTDSFQRPESSFQQEVENIDVGDVDKDLIELDAQINGL